MRGLPPGQVDARPLPSEAVEAAIRAAREDGRVEARGRGVAVGALVRG
jgi:hypothetical protein